MARNSSCDIAIVGGGLGGLALAGGLVSRGLDAHVFEAAPELRTSTATILSLSPSSFYALGQIDSTFPDLIRANGHRLSPTKTYARPLSGEEKITIMNADLPLVNILWAKLQELLAEKVPSSNVHCGHRCMGFVEHPDEGVVEVLFKDCPSVRAKLLVGADGVRSVIRKQLVPTDPGARYLGHMNWNAILDNPPDHIRRLNDEYPFLMVHGKNLAESEILVYLIRVSPDGAFFWQVRTLSQEPSWTLGKKGGPGLGVPGSKERLLKLLREVGWKETIQVVESTPESKIFERSLSDLMPLARWSSKSRRVVLLGDAAHAMHPGPGMGGRMAFEDAHQLVEALMAHWPEDLEAAITQYEDARVERCAIIQNFASRFSTIKHIADAHGLAAEQLDHATNVKLFQELMQWVDQYPTNPKGDPTMSWIDKLRLKKQTTETELSDGESLQQVQEFPYTQGELPAYMYNAPADEYATNVEPKPSTDSVVAAH